MLLAAADVVSLHVPLLPSTERMIDGRAIQRMRKGAMLINVSRGGLIDTDALIRGLEEGQLGAVGLDVYEQESSVFFEDWSATTERRMSTWDRRLALLTSFPNVIVTPHSAFLTKDALAKICDTTIQNVTEWSSGCDTLTNQVQARGFANN